MKRRPQAADRSAGKAGAKAIAMVSAAPKRMATAKKSAPKKKKPAPAKKAAAKKPVPAKKPAAPAAKPAAPRLATPIPSSPAAAARPPAQPPRPAAPPVRPVAAAAQSADERRKAATRKFFARLRSLEAIVGADLRKRGSLVLMQAVDQWYNEAISQTATDVSITNAAKAVIAHL